MTLLVSLSLARRAERQETGARTKTKGRTRAETKARARRRGGGSGETERNAGPPKGPGVPTKGTAPTAQTGLCGLRGVGMRRGVIASDDSASSADTSRSGAWVLQR
ncbi:hypothetical protein GCM10027418_14930 [Mariniluteicoccus endophyticus]